MQYQLEQLLALKADWESRSSFLGKQIRALKGAKGGPGSEAYERLGELLALKREAEDKKKEVEALISKYS